MVVLAILHLELTIGLFEREPPGALLGQAALAAARIAGLPLLETRTPRRPAVAHVIAGIHGGAVCHRGFLGKLASGCGMRVATSGGADYANRSADQRTKGQEVGHPSIGIRLFLLYVKAIPIICEAGDHYSWPACGPLAEVGHFSGIPVLGEVRGVEGGCCCGLAVSPSAV
jgi:hypothetical protein